MYLVIGMALLTGGNGWFLPQDPTKDDPKPVKQELNQTGSPEIQDRKLDQDSVEEIQRIRKRLGIRLFDDRKSDLKFENQLKRLNGDSDKPRESELEGTKTPVLPSKKGVPRPASSTTRAISAAFSAANPGGHPRRQTTGILFQAVENLDRDALELEKLGEFAKSKRLRQLSHRIQKQLRQMHESRDN
ncbi:MAG: hypothetical protein VX768_10370 [Planctomycetota bacterium]|nr:hypothetical protein [Planctomycetota bacterium]